MKKVSQRLFTCIMVIAMFAILSINAFAKSDSFTMAYQGYNCTGYLSVSAYSGSASINCIGIPGEPAILEPSCAVDGTAFTSHFSVVGRFGSAGATSCSAHSSWDGEAATQAECIYYFMDYPIKYFGIYDN